jgi:hypothetical protein
MSIDDRLAHIHRQVRHLIWMTGLTTVLLLAVWWQLCTIGSRLP